MSGKKHSDLLCNAWLRVPCDYGYIQICHMSAIYNQTKEVNRPYCALASLLLNTCKLVHWMLPLQPSRIPRNFRSTNQSITAPHTSMKITRKISINLSASPGFQPQFFTWTQSQLLFMSAGL